MFIDLSAQSAKFCLGKGCGTVLHVISVPYERCAANNVV